MTHANVVERLGLVNINIIIFPIIYVQYIIISKIMSIISFLNLLYILFYRVAHTKKHT